MDQWRKLQDPENHGVLNILNINIIEEEVGVWTAGPLEGFLLILHRFFTKVPTVVSQVIR